ncbi:MAG TPA: BamA/TamA family outer membrane protein, partial [Chthoniobacteraceae bacterium]|nr:BamA/TamA family outer membrane protein [Chthoniobacteraceae bacterium]
WKIDGGTLALDVTEGPFTQIEEVAFTGNQAIPSTKLRDYLLGATRERLSLLQRTLPYISADIETGAERLRGLYQSEGFLDSTVEQPEINFSSDKTRVIINVTVHEGIQYHFGKLNFDGDLVFRPVSRLENELKPFSDLPYTDSGVINMQRKLIYYYRVHGYFDAQVAVEATPETAQNGIVPVNFTITAGNVYHFGGVNVTGLDKLQPSFLARRFAKLRGQYYDPRKLDEIYSEMIKTGLFKSLRITSTPLPNNEVEMNLDVEEANSKEFGVSGGYGTFDGPILGARVGDRDFNGTGRPIFATFEYSAKLLRGDLTYTDPWFLETPNKLTLRVYSLHRDWQGYNKTETGFRGELARQVTKQLEVSLFALTRQVSVVDVDMNQADLGPTDYRVNSIGLAFTLDLRKTKNPIPGTGLVIKGAGELASGAFGSSISFMRGTLGASYYIPIDKTMLAIGARGGIISPIDGELPIDERFFNGGADSVRSFDERLLGPRDRLDNPLGGETFSTLNAEYTFPIVGDLDGAVFTDAGSVGQHDGFGEMRYGIGSGLRYRLPVGPLRLDYGWNPSPKAGEASGAIHFSFGFAF